MIPSKRKIHKNLLTIIFLNSIVPLSEGLKLYLSENIKSTGFSKGEMIYREGDLCNKVYLIKKGIVHGFFKADGAEITTWISSDNEFFTSITGYFTKQPIKENIQCLEEMYCDYIGYYDMQYCFHTYPEFRRLSRKLLEEFYVHVERKAYMLRIPSALKKWEFFLNSSNPKIVERIPKKYLASLLGMRRETLSRTIKQYARHMGGEEETTFGMGSEPDFCS